MVKNKYKKVSHFMFNNLYYLFHKFNYISYLFYFLFYIAFFIFSFSHFFIFKKVFDIIFFLTIRFN